MFLEWPDDERCPYCSRKGRVVEGRPPQRVPEPLIVRQAEREVCICAAIRLADGRVFRCHRHADGIRMVAELVDYQVAGSWDAVHLATHEQGFVTSRNRYVGREEGLSLQKAAGIESACKSGYRKRELFSEDLY